MLRRMDLMVSDQLLEKLTIDVVFIGASGLMVFASLPAIAVAVAVEGAFLGAAAFIGKVGVAGVGVGVGMLAGIVGVAFANASILSEILPLWLFGISFISVVSVVLAGFLLGTVDGLHEGRQKKHPTVLPG